MALPDDHPISLPSETSVVAENATALEPIVKTIEDDPYVNSDSYTTVLEVTNLLYQTFLDDVNLPHSENLNEIVSLFIEMIIENFILNIGIKVQNWFIFLKIG